MVNFLGNNPVFTSSHNSGAEIVASKVYHQKYFARLEALGDIWKPVIGKGINLKTAIKKLEAYGAK